MMTYLQHQNRTSQPAMGRKGRVNCRVTGINSDTSSSDETSVLIMAPGNSMTERQKMPRMARKTYWPS